MSTHLAHRLPWESLGKVYAKFVAYGHNGHVDYTRNWSMSEADEKKVKHFANCLADAVKEFGETDTRDPVDEEGNSLDPTVWNIDYEVSMGGSTGIYDSLLQGYVVLNLILMDPDKFVGILQMGGPDAPYMLRVCNSEYDGGHPEHIAAGIHSIFESHDRLKPVSSEVLQAMRTHAALLFRCLYSIGKETRPDVTKLRWHYSGSNRALDSSFVYKMVLPKL